jgi:hypothetical protein
MATSYEIIWEAAQQLNENLLLDAHPPIIIPYTPIDITQ